MSCLLFLRLGVIMGQKSETDFCIHRIASELVRGPTRLQFCVYKSLFRFSVP